MGASTDPSHQPPGTSRPADATADRRRGVLLGLAAGDRIGGPVRMALHLAESLVACRGFDPGHVGQSYLAWWQAGGFDTGPTASMVFSLVGMGMAFPDAAARADRAATGFTAGCNPAHRCAPLAMCEDIETEALAAAALADAALTHAHPLAGDVAAAVALLCRSLVQGCPWPDALCRAAEGRLPPTQAALDPAAPGPLSSGGFAPEVLAAALSFVHRASSFEAALWPALRFAGGANYCPVLVGSIAGACFGARQVPERALVLHAPLRPRLEAVSLALGGR